MPEDVAFLQLNDGAVEEMEVTAADGGAGDFEDDVLGFDDFGFGDFHCSSIEISRSSLLVCESGT